MSGAQVHYTRIDRIIQVTRGQYQVRCRCGYISRYFDSRREAEQDEAEHGMSPAPEECEHGYAQGQGCRGCDPDK